MKKILIALIIFLAAVVNAAELVGKVTKVSDGDTVWVTDSKGEREKIRLNGIDAPESTQAFGKEATKMLASKIGFKEVKVVYDGRDMYGRILGTIYYKDKDINLEMVAEGGAWVYFTNKDPAYLEAQSAAKSGKLGLRRDPNAINPYEYRKSRK